MAAHANPLPTDRDAWAKKYNLTYQLDYAMVADQMVGLRGKKVLEIGGHLPQELVLNDLGAARWIAIEELDYYRGINVGGPGQTVTTVDAVTDIEALGDYAVVSGRAERLTPAFAEQFDVIFSIAAFEHIDRLPAALTHMHMALKPGGQLFAMFSPIWSAHDGHHLHGVTDKAGTVFNFASSPIPQWGHLLMTPPQMYRHLLQFTDEDAATEIVYNVYNAPVINRLFTEDYIQYFEQSPFREKTMSRTFLHPIPAETLQRLQVLYPERQYFDNNGILAILTR